MQETTDDPNVGDLADAVSEFMAEVAEGAAADVLQKIAVRIDDLSLVLHLKIMGTEALKQSGPLMAHHLKRFSGAPNPYVKKHAGAATRVIESLAFNANVRFGSFTSEVWFAKHFEEKIEQLDAASEDELRKDEEGEGWKTGDNPLL